MIERQIVAQKIKEREIQEFILNYLGSLSCSYIKMQRTPLGERIIVYTSKPGLIVGKKGANIKILTRILKEKYAMDNPQIEVGEIPNPNLDAASVAKNIVSGLLRFGTKKFKVLAYKALDNVIKSGALGAEIVVSGRGLPGERAKSWRFKAGYLKKSGDIAESFTDKSIEASNLRSGTVGVKVSILHPDIVLPDFIKIKSVEIEETVTEGMTKDLKEVIESKEAETVVKEVVAVKETKEVKKRIRKKTELQEGEVPKETKKRVKIKKDDKVEEINGENKKE